MPRTSMLESLLSPTTAPGASAGAASSALQPPAPGTALVAGASHLVEAATAEGALAEVHDLLGPDARIVDARRVRRGGVGGFFTKEVVQLHVAAAARAERVDRSVSAALQGDVPAPDVTPRPRPRGESPVDRLLADAEDVADDVDFATYLRDQLSNGGVGRVSPQPQDMTGGLATPPPPAPGPLSRSSADPLPAPWLKVDPRPAREVDAADAPRSDGAGWSRDALLRIGLPPELVNTVEGAQPTDDLSWTAALTEALRPSCRPLPAGGSVLVGPRADRLGIPDDLADVEVARSRTWFAALREGRWVHVVVGGDGWRTSLDDEPMVVSWTRTDDLPEALRCAIELGLVLGYGPSGDGPRRAHPFDVALAVRELVAGR